MEGNARSLLLPEQLRPHCGAPRHPRQSASARSVSRTGSEAPARHLRSRAAEGPRATPRAPRSASCAARAPTPPSARSRCARSPSEIAALDEQVKALDEEFRELLAGIPNMPHESVPVGKERGRQRGGAPRGRAAARSISSPRRTGTSGPELGILDLERAAKITGARFALYWGLGAKLERALINFMLDVHTREHGYTEVLPPFLVNSQSLFGTGQLPKFAEDLFKCEGHDFWLIPTAEVPVTNIYRDETLEADALPVKLCAYTPCFRSEAGSYGRDVRGIIRQHQFQKVELVKFTRARAELRRAGEAHRRRRGHPAPPGPAVPHGGALHRRHGLLLGQDLRHRGLAARAERLQGNLLLLEFRGLPGAPRRHPLPKRGRRPSRSTP